MAKYFAYINDEEIEIKALTAEQRDKLMELIGSVNSVVSYDENMVEIIQDELTGFFDGQKTAEETAKLIQSRVSLYVSEQK